MRTQFRAFLSAIVIAISVSIPLIFSSFACAKDLTSEERTGLDRAVSQFSVAFQAGDFAAILEALPPRVMDRFLRQSGISKEEFVKHVSDLMRKALTEVKMISYAMDVGKAQAETRPDGTSYVLIPTQTVMQVPSGDKVSIKSHTLAIFEGGTWYLMRISDPPQVAVLVDVYPEFKSVTLPGDSTEILKD